MHDFPRGFEKVQDFKEIFDKGKKFKTCSSQIIVHLQETQKEDSKLSLGILALKKIVGKKAVCRNKAKRRFKHGFLAGLHAVTIEEGFLVKVIALTNKNTLSCSWAQVLADIEKELQYINKEIRIRKGVL